LRTVAVKAFNRVVADPANGLRTRVGRSAACAAIVCSAHVAENPAL
jgi:hypothetical protein